MGAGGASGGWWRIQRSNWGTVRDRQMYIYCVSIILAMSRLFAGSS